MDLSAQAQATDAGFELLKRLQGHPEFRGPVPVSVGESAAAGESVKEFKYAMVYEPAAVPAEEAPASRGDGDADAPNAEAEEATQ